MLCVYALTSLLLVTISCLSLAFQFKDVLHIDHTVRNFCTPERTGPHADLLKTRLASP